MSTLTKEQAQKIIEAADEVITALAGTNDDVHPESDNMLRLWDDLNDRYAPPEVVRELARIALESLEAEKMTLYRERNPYNGMTTGWQELTEQEYEFVKGNASDNAEFRTVFTAPPAPVSVPDAISTRQAIAKMENHEPCDSINVAYKFGWNACRAAMLQGAAGNCPAIPDGWVLVPVEPTEDMIVNGFESEPDESFSDEDEWEAYDAMSGCQQAAHRAKLCYAAMIAAAPKPKP